MAKCKRCGHPFESKSKLLRHLSNKKACYPFLSFIDVEVYAQELKADVPTIIKDGNKLFICKYCKKEFKASPSKCVHQAKCKLLFESKNNINTNIQSNNEENIVNTQNPINNTNIHNVNNNNLVNNGIVNNGIININVGTNIDNDLLREINHLIKHHKLNDKIQSFPSYTIGHLLEADFTLLKNYITKCKKEDLEPSTGHRSKFNFALELFKEVFSANDYRTKNTFIQEITDNVAYCYLEDKFYSISLEDLFDIFFQHLHVLLKSILKIKDSYNGMNADDKDYVEFSYQQFRDYIQNSDKIELKKEIINCMYNNKILIQELLCSAKPIDKFKDNDKRILNFESNLVNKIRKKYNLELIDGSSNVIKLNEKEIIYRDNSNVIVNDSEIDKIIVDFNDSFKITPNGYKLYKTKYKGMDIMFDPDKDVGVLLCLNSQCIVSKKKLINLITNIVDFTYEKDSIIEKIGFDWL